MLLDEIGELAGYELIRRFKDGDTEGLPGTALLQLYIAFVKENAKRDPEPDKEPDVDVLQLIESASVTSERKQALLDREIGRAKERLLSLTDARERL